MKVALVCIAKNEDEYIKEWIEYYLKLNFSHIYIYQNDWRTSFENENVTKIILDGNNKQRTAYNGWISNYRNAYDWVAFFDVDEFLVLKKHIDINAFVSDFLSYNSIGINGVMFGDNNVIYNKENSSVLKRFTKRQIGVNHHIKSIINLSTNNIEMDIHNSNLSIVDTDYNIFNGPFNERGNDNVAQLNHYWCKTKDEFLMKIKRGRSDTKINDRKISDFDIYNLNEISDFDALNFYQPFPL